jgi:hypothetical protein
MDSLWTAGCRMPDRDRGSGIEARRPTETLRAAVGPSITTCVLLAAVGVTLLLGQERGLYLLVLALVAVLVGGVVNAWLILVKLSE